MPKIYKIFNQFTASTHLIMKLSISSPKIVNVVLTISHLTPRCGNHLKFEDSSPSFNKRCKESSAYRLQLIISICFWGGNIAFVCLGFILDGLQPNFAVGRGKSSIYFNDVRQEKGYSSVFFLAVLLSTENRGRTR